VNRGWRPLTSDDLAWVYYLCRKRYAASYTPIESEGWFLNTVFKNSAAFFAARTEHAFVVAHLQIWPWTANNLICELMLLCADEGAMWEAIALARASIDWARSRRAIKWRISSETPFDLTPLAMRVGAKTTAPRCELDLRAAA